MADMIIACLSQKGGVGKSTLSRLIATAYADHGQRVAIMDFNTKQGTAVKWAAIRAKNKIEPRVDAHLANQANRLRTSRDYDVIVVDGRPDSADVTLSIAQVADFIVIPTNVTFDDLQPQVAFAKELVEHGIPKSKIMFVINRTTDNKSMIEDAKTFITRDFQVASQTVPTRDSFMRCHNGGHSIGEVRKVLIGNIAGLSASVEALALEIATAANEQVSA